MASSVQDDEFDEYDKPGAERSRRRRGDDDLDSDLEGDLLEEDWLTARKNTSDASDEELNDDLLQSDEEDENVSGQGGSLSLNATAGLSASFHLNEEPLEDPEYTEAHEGLEEEGYEGVDGAGGYTDEGYGGHYGDQDGGLVEDQAEYAGEQAEDEVYQDEVLDIGIDDPLDDEFQVDEYSTDYSTEQLPVQEEQEEPEIEEPADSSQIMEAEEMENETEQEEDLKEESDEEDDEDEESGRLRFKTERKDVTVVRLSDAASKRRNIPETLELSEEAKAHLLEFEEKERQRRQGRFGGRGRGRGGRGGRGGFPGFGMTDFRCDGGGRGGRMNMQRPPLMPLQMGMQSRMQPQRHPQQFQPPPRGPFHEPQPLIPPHMSHRSSPMHQAPLRPPMDPPRLLSPPPTALSPQQPKNIHINPHFRGPAASPAAQVPLMPVQNQPRPAAGPPRFPGPADFQQQQQQQQQQQHHVPGNYSQSPRPHHPEPWRGPPPPPPQEREPFFIGEPRFPGQHMFDQQSPSPLMNNSHAHPGQNPMGFNQSGPGFNQQGPQPMFPREPMRANLPPPGPLGMPGLGQHGPPNPRHFLPQRPQFPQPGPPLQHQHQHPHQHQHQHMQYGMQVRPRGLMHPSPHQQSHQHDPHGQQQQHPPQQRHDLPLPPPHLQQHPHLPMMHQGQQPPFRPPLHGLPQGHAHPRTHPQHPPPRANPIRPRMNSPSPMLKPSMQQMQGPPQRNSNLRELPVAPPSAGFGSPRPASTPAAQVRPIARAHPPVRLPERTVLQKVKKEPPAPQPGAPQKPQDPEEDEETRLYRMKIEEQKRLREEILKRKELRRQMQAGMRKRELLERLSGQQHQQQQQQQQQQQHQPQQQQQQQQQQQPPDSTTPPNGTPMPPQPTPTPAPTPVPVLTPAHNLRQNVKTRLQMAKGPGQAFPGGPQQSIRPLQAGPNAQAQWQQKKAMMNRQGPIRQGPQFQTPQDQSRPAVLTAVPGQGAESRPGVKRTVMQRTNSSGGEVAPVPQKVRVVKLLGEGTEAADGPSALPPQQQRLQPVPRQPPQIRLAPAIRKVTMGSAPLQQIQPHKPNLQQLAPHAGRGGIGTPQQNRVVVQGRGRAGPLQMGRGRGTASRQGARLTDGQPRTVSIEGLSSSTTDVQLKNLLKSIGPIQMFNMLPQQRKAVAKFVHPQHASSFQQSFHRHMIDLSHIDVSLIDG